MGGIGVATPWSGDGVPCWNAFSRLLRRRPIITKSHPPAFNAKYLILSHLSLGEKKGNK